MTMMLGKHEGLAKQNTTISKGKNMAIYNDDIL
jgi:hypothetical protein